MTLEEAQAKILADFEEVVGKEVLVESLTGYKDDDMVELYDLNPPALCRVTKTSKGDLLHQCDRRFVDPYWNLELIEPHEKVNGLTSLWMFGASYNLDTGEKDPARCVVAQKR
jgi:hypothetical protein